MIPIGNTPALSMEIAKQNQVKDIAFEEKISPNVNHQWKKTSSEFEMIHADTHEYTVWHNFIKKTRKCDITHRMKTDVWYCDLHKHTRSEVSLEETIHSNRHS